MMETITVYSSAESGSVEVISLLAEESSVTPSPISVESSGVERCVERRMSVEQRPSLEQRVSADRRVVKVSTENPEPTFHITLAQLSEAIASALRSVKIYVVESEITEAQRAVRAVVEESHF